ALRDGPGQRAPAPVLELVDDCVCGWCEQHGGARSPDRHGPADTLQALRRAFPTGSEQWRAAPPALRPRQSPQPRATEPADEPCVVAGADRLAAGEARGRKQDVEERPQHGVGMLRVASGHGDAAAGRGSGPGVRSVAVVMVVQLPGEGPPLSVALYPCSGATTERVRAVHT